MTSKFTKILEICLLVISLIGLVVFFANNASTGLYTVANEAEALATTGMLDIVLFWAYALVIAAIVLVVVGAFDHQHGRQQEVSQEDRYSAADSRSAHRRLLPARQRRSYRREHGGTAHSRYSQNDRYAAQPELRISCYCITRLSLGQCKKSY